MPKQLAARAGISVREEDFVAAARRAREIGLVLPDRAREVPVWVVSTAEGVYLRSYRAEQGRWYQSVLSSATFSIEIDDALITVGYERVNAPTTIRSVDDAYTTKYFGESELDEMLTPEVAATTLRIFPVD